MAVKWEGFIQGVWRRDEIRIFFDRDGNELAHRLNNNSFLMKLVYLSDMLHFWIGVEKDYPLLGKKALATLLPFATSCLCEFFCSCLYQEKIQIKAGHWKWDKSGSLTAAAPIWEDLQQKASPHQSLQRKYTEKKCNSCRENVHIFVYSQGIGKLFVQRQFWHFLSTN